MKYGPSWPALGIQNVIRGLLGKGGANVVTDLQGTGL